MVSLCIPALGYVCCLTVHDCGRGRTQPRPEQVVMASPVKPVSPAEWTTPCHPVMAQGCGACIRFDKLQSAHSPHVCSDQAVEHIITLCCCRPPQHRYVHRYLSAATLCLFFPGFPRESLSTKPAGPRCVVAKESCAHGMDSTAPLFQLCRRRAK